MIRTWLVSVIALTSLGAGMILGSNMAEYRESRYNQAVAQVMQKCLPSGKRLKWSEAAIDASILGLKEIPERRLP